MKRKDSFKSKLSQSKNTENDIIRKSNKTLTSINQLNTGIFKDALKKQENSDLNNVSTNNGNNLADNKKNKAPQIKLSLTENLIATQDNKVLDEKMALESRNYKGTSNDFDLFQKKENKNSLTLEDKSINEFKTSFNSTLLNIHDEENIKNLKNDVKCLSTPKNHVENNHLIEIPDIKDKVVIDSFSSFNTIKDKENVEYNNDENNKVTDHINKTSIDTDNNSVLNNEKVIDENKIQNPVENKNQKNLPNITNLINNENINKSENKSVMSKQSINNDIQSHKDNISTKNEISKNVKEQKDGNIKDLRDNKSTLSKKSNTKLEVIVEKSKDNPSIKQSKKDLIKIDDKIKDNQSVSTISKKSNVEGIKNEEVKKLNLKDISSELSDIKEKEQTSKRSDKRQQTTLVNNKNLLVEGLNKKMGLNLNFGADKDKDKEDVKKRKIIKHVKDDPEKKIIEEVEEPKKEETFLYKLKTNQELYQAYTKKFCNNYKISSIKDCQLSLKSVKKLEDDEILNIVYSYIDNSNFKQLEQLEENIKRKMKMIEEIENVRLILYKD